ncbi:MAG: extracellular catalytic domain type 2 short-chain-length polyhydroxyalkanoate depolymerase, partial [Burkholderiaceae bacterium]
MFVEAILTIAALGSVAQTAGATALSSYNVDPSTVSVSGLSAGGFMAAQLGVAYSSVYTVGFGVFAGGPFDCARNQNYTACMYNATPSISTPESNMSSWSGSQIDSLSNLANRKFYGWVGTQDTTVGPNVMAQLKAELQAKGVTSANTSYVTNSSAAHTFPTDYSASGDNACGTASSPYISNCSYDGAGAVLKWMYGTLNARTAPGSTLGGTVITFSQSEFSGGGGFGSNGYVYVPAACASGSVCKLHVALHGCTQAGTTFVNNTLYNNWADTNNIIILYPQAQADNTSHSTWDSGSLSNPNGCFDWIGWYGSNADQHGGQQMVAINAMVSRITSGYSGGTTTTTAGGTTTTTTATTTTTTKANAYDQTASATVTNHYIAGRINVTQYNTLGARYGYNTVITLYHCPSLNGWTDHSNCSA